MPPFRDLSNMRFGMLTIIRTSHKNRYGKYYWVCGCDCGRTTIVTSYDLLSYHTQSCGCLKERSKELAVDEMGRRYWEFK